MNNEELVVAIQKGINVTENLEKLYSLNIGMIEKIIKRYKGIEELEDLRQESYFGIARAAQLWNPDNGSNFITYAAYWVQAFVSRYVDNCSLIIRLPSSKRALIARYQKIVNSYQMQFGRDPSGKELCLLLDLTPQQLAGLEKDATALEVCSTSAPIGDGNESLTLEDTIMDTSEPIEDTINRIQQEELRETIWSCVDGLKDQQREVIKARYAEGKTFKECGEALGISKARAQTIETNALRALKTGKNLKRLRPYLTDEAAYILGLRQNGRGTFERYGSSPERAVMYLERMTGLNLYSGEPIKRPQDSTAY